MPDDLPPLPPPTPADQGRVLLLYHFCRLQVPAVRVSEPVFRSHLDRTFQLFRPKQPDATWASYIEGLYAIDWAVCVGCLEGTEAAWEQLFNARTGRSDCLLVDALRARSVRLYPRDEERQDTAVTEFWSNLIVTEHADSVPILARYDGQRPLAPWLIRVFQNWHLSKLRQHTGVTALPDDDVWVPFDPVPKQDRGGRWHEAFGLAAREWIGTLDDDARLLLGLRWRYRLSQREVAGVFGKHEGTISRRADDLGKEAREFIKQKLVAEGWTGDDLDGFVQTEFGAILTDDPRLSADQLGRLLAARGKALPG